MTGFTEKKYNYKSFSLKISIKSLNHRFFDWNYRGNPIKEMENRLRSLCRKRIHRGRIDVHIDMDFIDAARWEFQINEELLSIILSSVQKVSSRLQSRVSFSLENLFTIPHIADLKRKDCSTDELNFIETCFEKTLEELVKVRCREGKELKKEIRNHLRNIKVAARGIEKLLKKQPDFIRGKLKDRLLEIGEKNAISEEKLLEETAYLAQRYDISEEVERIRTHLIYFQELLSPQEQEPLGKKLDFLAQELFREANTINSKAQDIEIIRKSLTIKGELESIRQQVQNLE
jgi:uncharacterized protein (TIGR00255 family)